MKPTLLLLAILVATIGCGQDGPITPVHRNWCAQECAYRMATRLDAIDHEQPDLTALSALCQESSTPCCVRSIAHNPGRVITRVPCVEVHP